METIKFQKMKKFYLTKKLMKKYRRKPFKVNKTMILKLSKIIVKKMFSVKLKKLKLKTIRKKLCK